MTVDTQRIQRYRSQSRRFLDEAFVEMQDGRWTRSEDLLWGSLTLAVKSVALVKGDSLYTLEDNDMLQAYATRLGQQYRDRRIRNAYSQLASLSDAVEWMREPRMRLDYVYPLLDEVSEAIERLWQIVGAESNIS